MSKQKRAVGANPVHSNLDLDAILEQALDDFELLEATGTMKDILVDQKGVTDFREEKEKQRLEDVAKMGKMMDDMTHPKYGDALQSTFKTLSGTADGIKTVNEVFDRTAQQAEKQLQTGFVPGGPVDTTPENLNSTVQSADREVASTLKLIAEAQKGMEGFEAGKMEEAGESMMEEMMSQFEALGEKEDYNEVIDGVMRQLLSKDLMYEPTKQICAKFPEWLAINR